MKLHTNTLYELSRHLRLAFIFIAAAIVVASTFFTNRLANALAEEEKKKVETFAEAIRQTVLAEEGAGTDLILKIMESNTTIPVIITDNQNNVIWAINLDETQSDLEAYYKEKIESMKEKRPPITILIGKTKQYCYYDDSNFLKRLYYFPFVQFGVIFVFLLIAFFAFAGTKKAEQNQVWVGLSKETAHQLGTPISSLLAWVDLLKLRHTDDNLLLEMEKDVKRLSIIAERFSKIGSKPDLQMVSLNETMENAVSYLSKRTSQKVSIQCHFPEDEAVFISLNVPLFEWVIENLCKNAIDAMDGNGRIDLTIQPKNDEVIIDVKDSGKGMEKSKYKMVFTPGFTTKKRGWGLGLSLAKRIIEEYHSGKIFVKESEINKGTTFRIILKSVKS